VKFSGFQGPWRLKKPITSPDMRGKTQLLALSAFSGLLLAASWYLNLSILAFFGFVPLLLAEDRILRQYPGRGRPLLFACSYITFLIWNVLVTWWVYCVQFGKGGALLAFVCNAFLMAVFFVLFSLIKKRLNKPWAVWTLVPVWIAWEHIHTLWDISWTWLTLGNIFAFNHNWVQWYEFTGTSGGTLWILSVNILVFLTIKNNRSLKLFSKPVLRIAAAIIVPVIASFLLLAFRLNTHENGKKVNVTVVQPNIDPYGEKFVLDYQDQFFRSLALIRGEINSETDFLVFPETFITDDIDERFLNESEAVSWFRDSLLAKYPRMNIVAGGNSYVFYEDENDVTATARLDKRSGKSYDVFNTAIFITSRNTAVYHKSKLVPGVERMPFPAILRPLEKFAINMGGTMGSLGTQDERVVFSDPQSGTSVAPVICYESIYADYTTEYMRRGANLIFIITNDGWWDDTPGYVQHLNIGKLRAIENRRQIARSANTGISCFIDEYGNISKATGWWQEAVIRDEMHTHDSLTFFARFGDLISYLSLLLATLLTAQAVYTGIRSRRARRALDLR
jgi:apolipoprotein N-acyltransferase